MNFEEKKMAKEHINNEKLIELTALKNRKKALLKQGRETFSLLITDLKAFNLAFDKIRGLDSIDVDLSDQLAGHFDRYDEITRDLMELNLALAEYGEHSTLDLGDGGEPMRPGLSAYCEIFQTLDLKTLQEYRGVFDKFNETRLPYGTFNVLCSMNLPVAFLHVEKQKIQKIREQIDILTTSINQKNNEVILAPLNRYITHKNEEIQSLCNEYGLSDIHALAAQRDMLNALSNMKFMSAYINGEFGKTWQEKESISDKQIEAYIDKKFPVLSNTKQFLDNSLDGYMASKDFQKAELLRYLKEIKTTMCRYTKNEKKAWVDEFTEALDQIIEDTKNNKSPSPSDVADEVKNCLKNLQTLQDEYYSKGAISFFRSRARSELQPLINKVGSLLEGVDRISKEAEETLLPTPGVRK